MSDHSHTENLLRRWLNGQITHREEQQLEQAAKKDPFLAEALEGYRDRADSDHQAIAQQLRRRIRQRSGRFVWRQAFQLAAAVALLLAASWMIWQFTRPGQTPAISMNQDATPAPAEAPAPEAGLQEETLTTKTAPRKSNTQITQSEELLHTANQAQTAQPVPAAKLEEFAATTQTKVAETSSSLPAAPAPATPLYFGTVTNETGRPLPNIAVLSDDDQFITRTDDNGRFVTVQPNSGRILRFSPDGSNFQRIAPASQNINRYVLPPNIQTEQPDAARNFAPQKTARSAPAMQAAPQPAGGFNALQQHIRQNMRYPALALQYRIEGKVILSFTISPNGLPGDFEILESPGYGLDLEAVRLLQTGPSWTGGVPGQRYVHTVEFKLP